MRRIFWLLLFLLATPVRADTIWQKASSDHFVIYSDQKQDDILDFARRLERYHNAMQVRLRLADKKPSPSNRVTVYVLRDERQIKKLFGDTKSAVAGFYIPRAGGSVAFVPRVNTSGTAKANFSEIILLHEYAHHMMYSSSSLPFPLWLSEGFAEFHATAKFNTDGSVGLGLPAEHRAGDIFYAKEVPIDQLLDTQSYRANKGKQYDSFYGRAWTLFHYLFFDEKRRGQLPSYMKELIQGKSEVEAAQAFGDLKRLDRDLDGYLRQKRLHYTLISGPELTPGPIHVEILSEGASAMMPVHIRSRRGVDRESATELLVQAREIAARYPNDPFVQSALAEAEYDAGNDGEAIAAADRAIAADARAIDARLQKAYARERLARDASDADWDKAWSNVRREYLAINALENDHPVPLIRYFGSFAGAGMEPTANAVEGLEWALVLAPFDKGLRMEVARQEAKDGKLKQAIATLRLLVQDPHEAELAEAAQKLTEELQGKLAGRTGEDEKIASSAPENGSGGQ